MYCCFLGTILSITQTDADQNIIDADQYVIRDKKLVGCAFWSLPVSDIGTCARSCLRVKKCKSFNYHISTTHCDMNEHTHENQGKSLSRAVGWIYSEIEPWPTKVCFRF